MRTVLGNTLPGLLNGCDKLWDSVRARRRNLMQRKQALTRSDSVLCATRAAIFSLSGSRISIVALESSTPLHVAHPACDAERQQRHYFDVPNARGSLPAFAAIPGYHPSRFAVPFVLFSAGLAAVQQAKACSGFLNQHR